VSKYFLSLFSAVCLIFSTQAYADILGVPPISADSTQLVCAKVMQGTHKDKMVSWKKYQEPTVCYQATIEDDSLRYYVYVRVPDSDTSCASEISITQRLKDTLSLEDLEIWNDYDCDGGVDWYNGYERVDTAENKAQALHNEAIRRLLKWFEK
jgi:hypothetical protein